MRRCIALLITAFVTLITLAQPAAASDAGRFEGLANSARESNGVGDYAIAGDLSSVALGQAQRMAERHAIFHNPNLANEVSNWRRVGENVGVGSTVDSVHSAFMNSPDHRSNILSGSFTEMGVGSVVGDDGRVYVSEVFRLPAGESAAAAPVSAPAPAPRARATAPAAEPEPEPVAVPEPAPVVTTPKLLSPSLRAELPGAVSSPVSHPQAAASVHATSSSASSVGHAMWIAAAMAAVVLTLNAMVIRTRLQGRRVVAPRMA